MREILFRGKRPYTGEWVYGSFVLVNRFSFIMAAGNGMVEVVPETVGQYTGLVDRNGKRIFEGDVADHHTQGNILVCRGVINWDDKNAGFAHKLISINPSLSLHNCKAWAVVGNIHDNPELLNS